VFGLKLLKLLVSLNENRKHTSERPFLCYCNRRFSRLDDLRQHAQTAHANEDISANSLAATGTNHQRQVQSERVRTPCSRTGPLPSPIHNNDANFDTNTLTRNCGSHRNSASNMPASWGSSPKQPTSRSESVSSIQSDRIHTRFKNPFSRTPALTVERVPGIKKLCLTRNRSTLDSQEARLQLRLVVKGHWILWP
jgi:hypothetical protein